MKDHCDEDMKKGKDKVTKGPAADRRAGKKGSARKGAQKAPRTEEGSRKTLRREETRRLEPEIRDRKDITKRKRAEADREEILRELHKSLDIVSRSRKEWQDTFDSITDLISIIDKDFGIIKANMAFANSCGLHPREVIGKKCYELVRGCALPIGNCPHKKILEGEQPVSTELIDPLTKVTFRVATFPFHEHNGDLIGSIHIARDITLEKEQEEQLRRGERLASLGRLSAGMAHEINNPVNFIMANSRLLIDIWADVMLLLQKHYEERGDFMVGGLHFSRTRERIPKLFTGIYEGAKRIKNIVESLKVFTSSGMVRHLEPVDMNSVISSSLEILDNQIGKFTDHFVAEIEEDLPHVKGSSHGLEQVIVNLVMNALQSLQDRARGVTLSVRHDRGAGCIVAEITDQGAGMLQETLKMAGTPFYTTKRENGGLGLGLSISRSIIDDHGGSVEFISKPGEGTTATVKLPVMGKETVERRTS